MSELLASNSETLLPDATAQSGEGLSFRVLDRHQSSAALSVWKELDRRVGNGSLASSFVWTDTWLHHFGDLVPTRFLLAESDGKPRGLCLLTHGVGRMLGPLPVKSLHVGTAGEPAADSVFVEYNRLLVEPGYERAFVAGLLSEIQTDDSWDQFDLDGFNEADLAPFIDALPTMQLDCRPSRYFDLRGCRESGGDILARLGKSTRSNIRRRLKKYGDLDVQWAGSLSEADEIFRELVELHQARWETAEQPGAFASDRFRTFQHELMVRLVPDERVVLFRVRHEGETVGCLYLLVDGNRLLDYLSGFAPFEKKPSPGLITHYLCMQAALKRGFDAYDFLAGDFQHKTNLSTDSTDLIWAVWKRPTLKNRAVEALRTVRRQVLRTVRRF